MLEIKKHSCSGVLHREDYSDTGLNQYKVFISQPVTTLGIWDPSVSLSLSQCELLSTEATSWANFSKQEQLV